ncbi:hypothetical protein CPC16_006163 [Podila verticillata]|nr:hypothetical protein CPC16_006163 [Podila verticillata]
MTFLYALDLHEILILIAEHLDRSDILSCTKVSKTFYASFLPFLWQKVVVTQEGPNFSHAQHLLHKIHHLELQSSPTSSSVPTHGFIHLTTFKISGLDNPKNHHDDNWPHLTAILLNLGPNCTLVSFELRHSTASPAFWIALSQCHLSSLTIAHSVVPATAFSAFWEMCTVLESIHIHDVDFQSGGMPLPKNGSRLLRLKHLTHSYIRLSGQSSQEQEQEQEEGAIFPWIFAPHLETLCLVDGFQRTPTFDLSRMAEGIRLAQEAAATSRGNDTVKDPSPFETLIPGRKIRSLEIHTNRGHHDRDIAFLINNIKILQSITLEFPGQALQTFCALGRHRKTLTKIHTRFCGVDSVEVLTLLAGCDQLQILAAAAIHSRDMPWSQPWVCLGLKQLSVVIVVDAVPSDESYVCAARGVFERLGRLVQLEFLDLSGGDPSKEARIPLKVGMGLGQLQELKELQHLRLQGAMFAEMAVADAAWMVQHWPRLKTVQVRQIDAGKPAPEVEKVFADAGVLVKKESR